EQSAGFLRVPNGDNALDMTRMHPNDYALLDTLDTRPPDEQRYLDALRLPWTDLKSVVKQPVFNPEITKIQDLKPNMMLEGVVTRMTSFGAFIDIGIYPLGLLHISALAERFVRDPHEILYVGDVVRVTVLQVDAAKHRIALGMKAQAKPAVLLEAPKKKRKNKEVKDAHVPVLVNTAMADAFAKLKPGLS
ncbi:MAG: S1 RNA-binding domain-containing protein, partial [Gammaproteobacteria bacterium]|nr:S1 RNA-binding domain-containing protein [Gammaproteobacteria bacterium]